MRYVTSATAFNASPSTSQTLTIPTVTVGNLLVLFITSQINSGGAFVPVTPSSTGTTPTAIGSAFTAHLNTWFMWAQIYYFTASSSETGKVITATTSSNSYLGLSLTVYSAASSTQPDVQSSWGSAATTTLAVPSTVTVANGDWALYFASSQNTFSVQPGTNRATCSGRAYINDSNGPVIAGNTIGSGSWTTNVSQIIAVTMGFATLQSPGQGNFFDVL
jgi:hypothetical protein